MECNINIYKNKEYLFTVGGKHMQYDNVIWWELKDIIDLAKVSDLTKQQLIELITTKSQYLVLVGDVKAEEYAYNIDLGTKTIILDETVGIYDFDEEIPCIKVINHDGKYFAQYELGDEYPMIYVDFEDIDLLSKKELSFDEFYKVFDFINECVMVYDDTDYIVNNKKIMRFNFI